MAPEMMFKAPALELMTRRIAAVRRSGILDLGSPRGANVEYLSQFSCVLHVGDLLRTLADDPEMAEPEEERDIEGIAERLVAYGDDIRFDAIFAWDVFDYLNAETSQAIMRRVERHCRSGTLLYLTTSNRESIPDEPGWFTILDEQHLRFERRGTGARNGMKYSPRRLERIMWGFRLQHSFLLGDGMQDYIFVHD